MEKYQVVNQKTYCNGRKIKKKGKQTNKTNRTIEGKHKKINGFDCKNNK